MTEPLTQATTSKLSRRWAIRMVLITAGFIGFGLFGLYDAVIGYPKRGSQASEYLEYQYLQQLASEHQTSDASIPDPQAKLASLQTKMKDGPLAPTDRATYDWLDQLGMIGKLTPASASTTIPRTDFRGDDVRTFDTRLATLRERWTTNAGTAKSASPLSTLDLPSQWAILAVGVGVGLYTLALFITSKAKVYKWDPDQQRLTLPGGASLVPSDIEEFDKRKWHRLYVTLKVKPSHAQLGGQGITLDLMRYEPVEEWVLAMERTAFPEEAKPQTPPDQPVPG